MRDASVGDWLRRLPQYLYVAELIAGKRVLEVGCGTGTGAKFLADHGAALAVGVDGTASAIERAKRRYQMSNLSFRHENLSELELGDGSFDCVFVPDGMAVLHRPAVLRELRRVLAPEGYLVVSAPSADRATRVQGLSYHEISDALGPLFSPVRMVAQTPFLAMSLVEYGEQESSDIELDTSLIDWYRASSSDVVDYLAVCGGKAGAARGFAIVQLPTRPGMEVLGHSLDTEAGAGRAPAAGMGSLAAPEAGSISVTTQIAEALSAHAELTRELERTLAEERAYNDELREELEQTLERADAAERAKQGLGDKLTALQEEVKAWRSRASIAEGEAMRANLERGAIEAAEAVAHHHHGRGEYGSEGGNGNGNGNGVASKSEGDLATLREELAEARRKLERVTKNWKEAEAKNDAVWRRVGELQNELEQHKEQAVARSAEARRTAQLDMAKAVEGASAKLVGVKDQLARCEKRCETLEAELKEITSARDALQKRIQELEAAAGSGEAERGARAGGGKRERERESTDQAAKKTTRTDETSGE